jgi:DNA polymerase III delta prime subunit
MSNLNHSLWVEKYRPSTLDGYIGNEAIKNKFAQYIAKNDIPHLLLVGPPGTGKTTAAKILTTAIDADVMFLNASDDNNIETVRGKIRNFASTIGMAPLKIIVLDEFDGFSRAGQEALRNLMERYSQNTRFILTANYAERISEPIISRVQLCRIEPPSIKDVCVHVAKILKTENITYTPAVIKLMTDTYFPDIRKVLNELQLHVTDGEVILEATQAVNNDVKVKIIELLKTGVDHKKTFTDIRQLVANAQIRDFTDIFRALFDRVDEYMKPDKVPSAILAIADAQYRDSHVVDKEINAMSMFVNILQLFPRS